jgi:hypothetical protein
VSDNDRNYPPEYYEALAALEAARRDAPADDLAFAAKNVRDSIRCLEAAVAGDTGELTMAKVYLVEASDLIEVARKNLVKGNADATTRKGGIS